MRAVQGKKINQCKKEKAGMLSLFYTDGLEMVLLFQIKYDKINCHKKNVQKDGACYKSVC